MVFSLERDNQPVEGCTVSQQIAADMVVFSLAKGTDISAESYQERKMVLVLAGEIELFLLDGTSWRLAKNDCVITPRDVPFGARSADGAIYLEVILKEGNQMDQKLQAGEVFHLASLVPYAAGRIVNRDIISGRHMKFVVMSFDAGTGLGEHAAPGDAIVFALDGEAVIGYEGKEYPIKAGEQFRFAKNGRHSVKAERPFKMTLLLTLDE